VTKRNGALRGEVEEKSKRIRALEEELLTANQRRQDVIKRVDELIAQIDQVDVQLQSLEEAQ
jgi:chromosome segregation ATPase